MWLRGNFPGVPWPRPPSVSSPRTPRPPRVWVGGRGGGRTSPHAYSQPRTERAALTPAALHRPTAQTCRSLGLFFFSCSFIWGEVSFLAVCELLHSDTMSEISVNEHLEGIISDFEGMWTGIFRGFTANPLWSPVKPQWDRVLRGFDLWRPAKLSFYVNY